MVKSKSEILVFISLLIFECYFGGSLIQNKSSILLFFLIGPHTNKNTDSILLNLH